MSIDPPKNAARNIVQIFFFCAKEDQKHFFDLEKRLKILQRQKPISFWSNINMLAGTNIESEMRTHLNTAHIILLLISSASLDMDEYYEIAAQAMERQKSGEVHVIPIILSPCGWKNTVIGGLQIVPRNEKPILSWNNQEEAFEHVAEEISKVVDVYLAKQEANFQIVEKRQIHRNASPSPSELHLPDGWVLLKPGYLEKKYRLPLSEEQALFYFDGGIPDWQLALSSQIPRREKVSHLQKLVEENSLINRSVTILLGGGGEGKSTILRQTICDLLFTETPWNLIWHEDENKPLPVDFCRKLPTNKGIWLIASDGADRVAGDIFDTVRMLHEDGRKDIHFLLCCRHIDWKGVGADKYPWGSYSKYSNENINPLTLNEARLIVEAWGQYGSKGLAKLADYSPEEATRVLLQKAESQLSQKDGSFLGAMLQTRYPGAALDEHVLALLTRLDEYDHAFQRDLVNAYAYIVALHAEGKLILIKEQLAHVLRCRVGEVQQRFIGLLEREAATTTHPPGAIDVSPFNKYVLARHQDVARVAVRILAERFYVDFDDIYETLFRSAIEMFIDGGITQMPLISQWRKLYRYLFDKGKKDIAFRLAHLSLSLEPNDPLLVVECSRLYQDDQQYEMGAKIFRDTFDKLPEERKDSLYYHEWATAEGKAENNALSAWLDGIALADGIPLPKRKDRYNFADRMIIALDGMSIDFENLFEETGNATFRKAWGATVQLGLAFKGTAETTNAHQRLLLSRKRYLGAGVRIDSLPLAVEYMQDGIIAAWEAREVELPEDVRSGKSLTFFQFKVPKG